MISIDQLRILKKDKGYTNEMIARLSGVPIGTVQKIFAGITKRPRYDTLKALEQALGPGASYDQSDDLQNLDLQNLSSKLMIRDSSPAYRYNPQDSMAYQEIGGIILDRQGQYTIEDMELLPQDGRYELIDGVIYDMAGPTFLHQILIGMIYAEFLQYKFRSSNDCWPVQSPFDVRLDRDQRTMVEPDLMVICSEEEKDKGNDQCKDPAAKTGESILKSKQMPYYEGAPKFVMEVISPQSRRRDLIIKLNKYMKAGVSEYWIVDPEREQILVYDFQSEGYPDLYTFHDIVPVAVTHGELTIDFNQIMARLS